MKLLQTILTSFLVTTVLAPGGVLLWTRESYEKAIQDSSVVFNAKVVDQSQQYYHEGKKIDVPDRGNISRYFEEGKELPVVHTTVTLEITAVEKGDSLKVGQRIEVAWKDTAFVMCPHPENTSLGGKERKWRDVGDTYKILPETLHKKEGDRYIEDNGYSDTNPPTTAPESKPESKEKPNQESEGRSQ